MSDVKAPEEAPQSAESLIAAIAKKRGIDTAPLDTLEVDGRVLKLRNPGGANYLKALELSGGATQLIPTFESLLCITFVDNVPQAPITNRAKLDILAETIGRRAVEALQGWYQEKLYPEVQDVIDENPGMDVTSPEFQELVRLKRNETIKKS